MNFIYDIILNFNNELYESFEWDIKDTLLHVKKIPTFKISKKDYFNIKNNKVGFNEDFLSKIFKQNGSYRNNKLSNDQYLALIAFEEEAIAIKLNNNGEIKEKSHLLIDEENMVLKTISKMNTNKIEYKILSKTNNNPYLTRKEKDDIKKIINEITKLYKKSETNKLKYLYLECFNKSEKNIDTIFQTLKKEVIKTPEVLNKVIDFFNLIKQK